MGTPNPADSSQNLLLNLRQVLNRFPQGLGLDPQHLAVLGWLRHWEEQTARQTITDRELSIQIARAVDLLGLSEEASAPRTIIERLMHFRLLRNAISQSARHEYCLTRLGRNLARDLLEEVQFGTDDLCALINYAFTGLKEITSRRDQSDLPHFLAYQFLGANREAIEYKLQGIEEGILTLEKRIKELAGGKDQEALDQAVQAIQANRAYVEELVAAIQEGSSFIPLQRLLAQCREASLNDPHLTKLLDRSLDFLHGISEQVDQLLVHVVDFIHQCLNYQTIIGSLSTRDRLCGLQQALLKQALRQPAHMPTLEGPRCKTLAMDWSAEAQNRPAYADQEALQALSAFVPQDVRRQEAVWKEPFLDHARDQWRAAPPEGFDLATWLTELLRRFPNAHHSPLLGLWYLLQDWPQWDPPVRVQCTDGPWPALTATCRLLPVRLLPGETPDEAPRPETGGDSEPQSTKEPRPHA
ncbi:MAG: hypothetical protein ACQESV_07745 [Thermodesulfobacteriota bacterium]